MVSDGDTHKGCGKLITLWTDPQRPMRQPIFDRVRASGLISRAPVAKDLGVSPASVTTSTAELLDDALIVEGDGDGGIRRGRPSVAFGSVGAPI